MRTNPGPWAAILFLQFLFIENLAFFSPKIRKCSHINSRIFFQKLPNFWSKNYKIFCKKKKKNKTKKHRSWPFMIEMSKTWGTHSKQYLGSRAIQDPTIPFSFLIGSMYTCSLPLSASSVLNQKNHFASSVLNQKSHFVPPQWKKQKEKKVLPFNTREREKRTHYY
jgi:hypothetical protein